jgi:hypothetical protein
MILLFHEIIQYIPKFYPHDPLSFGIFEHMAEKWTYHIGKCGREVDLFPGDTWMVWVGQG